MDKGKQVEKEYEMFNYVMKSDSDDEEAVKFIKLAYESEALVEYQREKIPRIYIHRDRGGAAERLWNDYFSETPTCPPKKIKRRFRMRCQLFMRIVGDITQITSAIRQLAYGAAPYSLDEYLQMSETSSFTCLENFCHCVIDLYGREYLRDPNATDIARLYSVHEEKHSFRGMLGSIDCMHWQWENCPNAWKGQYTRGDRKGPTVMLEAVASHDMWIWHAFFGMAGSNNDINVLNNSSLFYSLKNGSAPPASFYVNGHQYTKGYYLADGIYPDWATLIKGYSQPTDEKRVKFKRFQESARKDVERTFGVLQGRFAILKCPAR
ncbi:uncharacterized protein [Rutidosis leptorrhynchoides]|uniref:uncharacterized protein n=1 Tax=Rutidosis leptorrhynchoides TaxID=125765 RepID=UPI003A99A256